MADTPVANGKQPEISYRAYDQTPEDLQHIIRLVETELSEPYTVYTYRYFLHQWPSLAFLAFPNDASSPHAVGIVVCKLEKHRGKTMRGYLAMLSVHPSWRQRGIAKHLLRLAIDQMREQGADEVVLETEADNTKSLALYERMGFWREKRLWRFYLNGKDAFRLILPLRTPPPPPPIAAPPSPPPPVHVEDDFDAAPFLSTDTFTPLDDVSPALELSPRLAALAQHVPSADDGGDEDVQTEIEMSSRTLRVQLSDDDDGDGHMRDDAEDEDDLEVELEDLPGSPVKPPAHGLQFAPSPSGSEASADEDDDDDGDVDLEGLEVSDEEGAGGDASIEGPLRVGASEELGDDDGERDADGAGGWDAGRRLTETMTGVSL